MQIMSSDTSTVSLLPQKVCYYTCHHLYLYIHRHINTNTKPRNYLHRTCLHHLALFWLFYILQPLYHSAHKTAFRSLLIHSLTPLGVISNKGIGGDGDKATVALLNAKSAQSKQTVVSKKKNIKLKFCQMINLQMTKTSKTQKKNWQDIKICISAQTNDYNGCTVCLQMPCQSSTNQQLLPTRCNTCTHIQASCATLSGNWRLNCCWKIAKEKNLKSISLFRCN